MHLWIDYCAKCGERHRKADMRPLYTSLSRSLPAKLLCYLNDYTLYVVEDITGTHADPYHYLIEFHTEFPVNVDVKP